MTLPDDVCLEEAWDVDCCAGGQDDGQQLVEAGGGVAEVPLPVLVRAAHSRAPVRETLYCIVLLSSQEQFGDQTFRKNIVFQVFSMYFDSMTQHCPSLKRI